MRAAPRHALRCCGLTAALSVLALAAAGPAAAIGEPSNDTPPTISGTLLDGRVLSASTGTWSSLLPIEEYSYNWIRCATLCVGIPGASSSTYQLTPNDIGARMQVRVGATNILGTNYAYSSLTAPVQAIPPTFATDGLPLVVGTPREGETLEGTDGFYSGSPPLTVSSRGWVRCDASGNACSGLIGSGATYTLTENDVGSTIRHRVEIQGPQHSVVGFSEPTAVIDARPSGGGGGGNDGGGGGNDGGGGDDSNPPTTRGGSRLLRPFPTILVAGRVFPLGVVISKFVVRGPNGARVVVRCRGRTCPVGRLRRRVRGGKVRLRRLETNLLFGTVIEIRVRKGNRVGKYTRLRIRRGKAPARRDLCLEPGARRPTRCPGA